MEQPPESPTFQEGNMVQAKEMGLLMSNVNAEPVSKEGNRYLCVAALLTPCTLSLFEAGSCLVVRFLSKARVIWQRSTKLIHVNDQANHLPVKQSQNRGYLNRANHSDGEIFHQFPIR